MRAKSHRYTLNDEKEKNIQSRKKTFFQTISSILVLVCSLYVCYSDNPKLNFFKNYIRTSLNVSTDISEAKAFAKNIYKKNVKIKKEDNNEIFEETQIDEQDVIVKDETVIEYPNEEKKLDESIMPAFKNPTEGEITSVFGVRIHPVTNVSTTHTGIDIAGNFNQCVISAAEGRVLKCREDEINGKYIIIEHNGGYQSAYAHLNEICVTEGEWVDDNTKIGLMGESGMATGVHLHFEIKKDNERLDPEEFVKYNHRG